MPIDFDASGEIPDEPEWEEIYQDEEDDILPEDSEENLQNRVDFGEVPSLDEIVESYRRQQYYSYQAATSNQTEWTFTSDTNMTSVPFVPEYLEEGEEVPITEPAPNEYGHVRPAPYPSEFAVTTGCLVLTSTSRRASSERGVSPGYILQVSVWEMRPAFVRSAYSRLKEWMVENGFGFSHVTNEYYTEGDANASIPYFFTLCDINDRNAIDPAELLSQPDCSCGEELEYPTLKCPACDAFTYCGSCRHFSDEVRYDNNHGTHCRNCSVVCENEDCESGYFHVNNQRCPSCNPSVRCRSCPRQIYTNDEGTYIIVPDTRTGEEYMVCSRCVDGLCHSCFVVESPENIIVDEGHQCVNCISKNSDEEWDGNSELENSELAIPTIPGREVIRLVGVEIEGANGEILSGREGGNVLARTLYDNGLSRLYEMGGYHSGNTRNLVHVERDSSVDWELVIGPLNVAESQHVDILNRSVKVVRSLINEKSLKLDMRAGLHIHVGADRVPFHNAYNLHKLYMYMEDFLYRFGAAKWPYHRSINRRGRDQAGKSPIAEGKLNFARTFSGQRYYGLSFDNYFARYFEQCGCGARTYGLFDECTCDLGKCTFEFRLFNTTANTVKLHAYLAICQALVAKAIDMDEIKDTSKYPALDFVKSRVPDMNSSTKRKMNREWEKRIVFVNEQLPLTPEEKKSIHYCIMNSEMGKLVTNADILLETEDN